MHLGVIQLLLLLDYKKRAGSWESPFSRSDGSGSCCPECQSRALGFLLATGAAPRPRAVSQGLLLPGWGWRPLSLPSPAAQCRVRGESGPPG